MENGTYTVTSLKKCINYSKPGLFVKIMWEGFISVIYLYIYMYISIYQNMVSKSQRDDTCCICMLASLCNSENPPFIVPLLNPYFHTQRFQGVKVGALESIAINESEQNELNTPAYT